MTDVTTEPLPPLPSYDEPIIDGYFDSFSIDNSGPKDLVACLFITNSPGVSIAGTVSEPIFPPLPKYLGTIPPIFIGNILPPYIPNLLKDPVVGLLVVGVLVLGLVNAALGPVT